MFVHFDRPVDRNVKDCSLGPFAHVYLNSDGELWGKTFNHNGRGEHLATVANHAECGTVYRVLSGLTAVYFQEITIDAEVP